MSDTEPVLTYEAGGLAYEIDHPETQMDARVFSWDWKAQPDMVAIAAAVTTMSADGQVFMREINTGSDRYAWVVSGAELTDEQVWRLFLGEDEED